MKTDSTDRVALVFDIGTQSARALLVDRDGAILGKRQIVYDPAYESPHPGWAEQDPDMYYGCICKCAKLLREDDPDAFSRVAGVTVSAIRDTAVCVGRDGKPVRPAMVWTDKRLAKGNAKFNPAVRLALKAAGALELAESNYKKAQCNIIMEEQPEIWAKTYKYFMLGGYLNYRLTGRFADAVAGIVGHIPFDARKRDWKGPRDIVRPVFDIPREKLPDPVETGDVIGYIGAKAAEETGIKEGTPVYPSGADKACEVIGMGCLRKEQVALSFGTMATANFTSPEYYELQRFLAPFPSVIPGWFAPEYEVYRGYWLVSWFLKEFAELEESAAKTEGRTAVELLNEKLAEIPAGCDGLLFQPYFTPNPTMPMAKGGFVGMTDHHGRVHMYRAIIEGINYGLMEGIRQAEAAGKFRTEEIRLGGGGSQSAEICQLTANMFGVPVVRLHTHEVTGIGAAMACFVAMGEYADFPSAAAAMVHERDRFEPDEKEHALYKALYEDVWTDIFEKLAPLYRRADRIYEKLEG